jgi:hypothetical protein
VVVARTRNATHIVPFCCEDKCLAVAVPMVPAVDRVAGTGYRRYHHHRDCAMTLLLRGKNSKITNRQKRFTKN